MQECRADGESSGFSNRVSGGLLFRVWALFGDSDFFMLRVSGVERF